MLRRKSCQPSRIRRANDRVVLAVAGALFLFLGMDGPAMALTVACGESISDAVNEAPPGSTIVVTGPCSYSEYVFVVQPGQTITTDGGAVTAQGIDFTPDSRGGTLAGNWLFTNTSKDPGSGWGIHIEADNITIDGSQIAVDGVCFEGIYVEPGINGANISGVTVNHAMQAGIHLDGNSTHLSHFRITNVLERREGCDDEPDADYISFGNRGSINGVLDSGGEIDHGYMDGTAWGSPETPEPTTLSCYVTDGGPASGWLIHDNICYFAAPDYAAANEAAAEVDSYAGPVNGITFWNNIFGHMTRGIALYNSACARNGTCVSAINVVWQTFIDIAEEAVMYDGVDGMVQNNIFYNVGSGADDYGCALDKAELDSNLLFHPEGRYGTYCGPWPAVVADPYFPATSYGNYNLTTSRPAGFHAP